MMLKLWNIAIASLFVVTLAVRSQEEAASSAFARLNEVVSNLVSSAPIGQDTRKAYALLPKVEAAYGVATQLLVVVNAALENTDRLATEFNRQASSASTDPQQQQFYRNKAATLTRQTDQLFKRSVELERNVAMLSQLMDKLRSDPAVRAKGKADETLNSATATLEPGVRSNLEGNSKSEPLKPKPPFRDSSKP